MITQAGVGFLTGLSVGIFCLGVCLPVFLPLLLGKKKNTKKSFLVILEFSLGRLAGYLLFGLFFGWLGAVIKSERIHLLVSLVNLWLGISLIVFSLGMIDRRLCHFLPMEKIRWPALFGFLTGVNVCPPFLASLSYVFNLGQLISSLVYFLGFFLGTTLYLVPVAFLGALSRFSFFEKLGRFAGVVAGIYFVFRNLFLFL